ncbi:ATP-binding protein [Thermococcus thermotolerans]|uniref:ATP-binding protein n=1 Tax=Thermococcus thermotolerans TaxID=2969672 RepID=UPI002157DE33|nr:ATP-binding protein [Thermococcus thermotolerans]
MEDLALVQNPWWSDEDSIYLDERVKRALSKKPRLFYRFEPVNKVLIGPRQVGKTTYMKLSILNLIESGVNPRNILYFSGDLLRDYKEIVSLVRSFLRRTPGEAYVFLDEVTFVGDWERAVKFLLDSPLASRMVLQVTGSTSAGLKRESFPGRSIRIEEFLPLDFRLVASIYRPKLRGLELPHPNPKTPREFYENSLELYPFLDELLGAFDLYLSSGGYPSSIYELLGGEIPPETYEMVYNATILDVVKLGRSERIALSLILGLLRRYGDRVSLNSLAKELEIGSHVTVRDYLELFEELFIGRNYFQVRLHDMTPLFRRERKFYFLDPLLIRTFSKLFGVAVDDSRLIEGVVGEHLKRLFPTYYFYGSKEIDFIAGNMGIEVKWRRSVSPSDFPRVGVRNKILLSKTDLEFIESRNLAIIPVPFFLFQLHSASSNLATVS